MLRVKPRISEPFQAEPVISLSLGHFQVGNYRYRSHFEGLYIL